MEDETIYRNKYCRVNVIKGTKGDAYAVVLNKGDKIVFKYKNKQDAIKYAQHLESYAPMWVKKTNER